MIHSPFGQAKNKKRAALNRTKDEESLLLTGRDYSAFGKGLNSDSFTKNKSLHEGSRKRYQVKSDFEKQVESRSQKYSSQ